MVTIDLVPIYLQKLVSLKVLKLDQNLQVKPIYKSY